MGPRVARSATTRGFTAVWCGGARICTRLGRLGRRDGRKSGSETVVLAAEVFWELK